jgi:hypothetical protein
LSGPIEELVVVGAGNTGAEVACALAARGVTVTVATREPVVRPDPTPETGFAGRVWWWASGVPISCLPRRVECAERTPIAEPHLFDAIGAGHVRVEQMLVSLTLIRLLCPPATLSTVSSAHNRRTPGEVGGS